MIVIFTQQYEQFWKCQNHIWSLQIVQNVKSWFDFTYNMFIWAYYLQIAIDSWISDSENQKLQKLKLSSVKWKHMMYMIAFLYSFHVCIKHFSATKNFTVHQAWQIYNKLFQHLENQYAETEQKIEWKNMITISIDAAWDKFKKYYENTNEKKNIFYAVMIVLNSCFWMNVYKSEHWTRNEQAIYW